MERMCTPRPMGGKVRDMMATDDQCWPDKGDRPSRSVLG